MERMYGAVRGCIHWQCKIIIKKKSSDTKMTSTFFTPDKLRNGWLKYVRYVLMHLAYLFFFFLH